MRNLIRALTAALLLATLPLAANAAVFVSVSIAPPALPVYVAPPMPGAGLLLDARILGVRRGTTTTGCRERGCWLRPRAALDPRILGMVRWRLRSGTAVTGDRTSVSMAASITASAMAVSASTAATGEGGRFVANTTVINNTTIVNNTTVNRVSYNGGAGGVAATATPAEMRAAHENHVAMSEMQQQHEQAAARDTTMRASYNHGRPSVAATAKAGVFYGKGVVAARSAAPAAHESGTAAGQPPGHGNRRRRAAGRSLATPAPDQPRRSWATPARAQPAIRRTRQPTAAGACPGRTAGALMATTPAQPPPHATPTSGRRLPGAPPHGAPASYPSAAGRGGEHGARGRRQCPAGRGQGERQEHAPGQAEQRCGLLR